MEDERPSSPIFPKISSYICPSNSPTGMDKPLSSMHMYCIWAKSCNKPKEKLVVDK